MATTLTEATDHAAIEAAIQLYIDGASKGDAEKINEAFHEAAWMYGHLGGQRFDMPAAQLAETVAAQPLDSDGSFSARIASLEQVGDVARVTLEEDGCWGGISFVDYFTLAKIDGTWKIVNKTFAHTGGEMPSA
ncbi:MAG: nuclear transport factor 2 family protein [Gaiellaceae bacterium]